MAKIILIILIIAIYYSNELDECENHNPISPEQCYNISNKNEKKYSDFCCYFIGIKGININNRMCKTVPYSSYYTGYNTEFMNETLYNVSCKNTDLNTYALEQCGNIHKNEEASLNNCKEYSTFVDSCCFFSGDYDDTVDLGEQKLVKGCYWLGSKYEGKITWAGAKLECHHNYLNYSLFYLFSIVILMIYFF